MSSISPPSTVESFRDLTQLDKAYDLAYFYYVYKLECQVKGVENTDIAADLRGSPGNEGVGTFWEFIRYIIPRGKVEDIEDSSEGDLDTLLPDVGWIRHNLGAVRFPCPDFERLHKHIKQSQHPSMMILSVYDAMTDTFEKLVKEHYTKLSSSPDMEGARDAAGLILLFRPGSSDTPLRKYLEALKKDDGSPRHVLEGLYEAKSSEGSVSCGIDRAKTVERVRLEHGSAEADAYKARLDADEEAFWDQAPVEGGPLRRKFMEAFKKKARRVYDVANE